MIYYKFPSPYNFVIFLFVDLAIASQLINVPVVDQFVRSDYCRCIDYAAAVVAAELQVEVEVWAAAALLRSASTKSLTFG